MAGFFSGGYGDFTTVGLPRLAGGCDARFCKGQTNAHPVLCFALPRRVYAVAQPCSMAPLVACHVTNATYAGCLTNPSFLPAAIQPAGVGTDKAHREGALTHERSSSGHAHAPTRRRRIEPSWLQPPSS